MFSVKFWAATESGKEGEEWQVLSITQLLCRVVKLESSKQVNIEIDSFQLMLIN